MGIDSASSSGKSPLVPFYLAPMAEISHRALRELIEGFGGCDAYFSEMISAGALLAGGQFEKWYIDNGPNPEKCVFQLIGSDPQVISKASAFLDNIECAGIDINMGCSAPLIRKTGAGAAWMASADRAGELINKVRPMVKRRLSVKLRIGFNDDFEYLVKFCRRLEEEGVDLITLHPRTVMEKFKRLARWKYVSALKKELKIPVAGNGDISNAEELVRRAGGLVNNKVINQCDAVMVGRAAVRHPWIFAQAKEMINRGRNGILNSEDLAVLENTQGGETAHVSEYIPEHTGAIRHPWVFPNIEETGLCFLELLSRYQPPEFHISRARHFFGFFCDNLKWGNYLKNKLNMEESLSGIEQVWRRYFAENEE